MRPRFAFFFVRVAILSVAVMTAARGEVVISPADPGSIQRALDEAAREHLSRVVVPPGTYRLAAGNGGVHLHCRQLKNCAIEAAGAILIFTTGKKGAILFDHCENVTFRGATLLRDPIPFSQGKITSLGADGTSCDVAVSNGYPMPTDENFGPNGLVLNLYRASDRQWQSEFFGKIEKSGNHSFRFHANRLLDESAGWIPRAAIAWRGPGSPDLNLSACRGMKILGVTVENGAGFCFFEHDGQGGNDYNNCTVTYGPKPQGATEEPLLSSDADAFHSAGMRQGPTLENCLFEGMNDDGIAVHGHSALVEEAEGNRVIVDTRDPSPSENGDRVRFVDESTALAGEAKIVGQNNLASYHPANPPPP